jgi:putative membrane protein
MKGIHLPTAVAALMLLVATGASALDSSDRKFTTQAASSGLAEVELAQLARQNAGSDAVKQYAEHLYRDHQQANETLKSLASKKGVQLPTELDGKHKRERERLANLKGAEFDKAYVRAMVKDHKSVINSFEKQAKQGQDAELKAFAAQTLPKLREHLNHAQQLQSQLKAGDGKS